MREGDGGDIVVGALVKVGEGTFGTVYRTELGGETVAVKRSKSGRPGEGVPIATYRELCALRRLPHSPHLVHLRDVGLKDGRMHLTLGYMDMTLAEALKLRPHLLTRGVADRVFRLRSPPSLASSLA